MRIYLFSDLDDSLFQTLRKIPKTEESNLQNYIPVDWINDKALCFMSPRQKSLLSLFKAAQIIPVTARNLEAFKRINLPFSHGAILNYGATILLPNGEEDLKWKKKIFQDLNPFQSELENLFNKILEFSGEHNLEIRARIIGINDCMFYVVIKNQSPENDFLEILVQNMHKFISEKNNWFIHLNGNNLAFIPICLDKANAVEYLIDTHIAPFGDDYLTFGLGDSIVDINFINKCHFGIIPNNSQIHKEKLNG